MKTFKLWLESDIDRESLNQFLRTQKDWANRRQSGEETEDFRLDQRNQIQNLIDVSKSKIVDILNSSFSKEWKEYSDWEKEANKKGIIWGSFSPNFEKLGPHLKIGTSFDFSNDAEAVVTKDFYDLLMWREIIKTTQKALENSSSAGMSTQLAQGVTRLAALFPKK